ncbi:MAG: SLC45 family MFS transporter [Alistipes sp.]|nr:SLC45 family MFS transporter [Alistipes sp.]
MNKPNLTTGQMWNLSFGFFGVQIAYALQSANISRIFATLGADPHSLSFFWVLPPLMGMIVQPIVGSMSDKTWCKWGRRKPYLFIGAIVAIIVMALLPNSGSFDMTIKAALAFGAIMLMLLDTSINMAMQPFKMLVGDMVNDEQKTKAYSIQSLLCNAGSLVGYLLPFCLTWIGVSNIAPEGVISPSVTWSFYIGAAILILCVLYTGAKVKEWNPEEYAKYNNIKKEEQEEKTNMFKLLVKAPKSFWQIGLVQFFSWFAFLFMWTYTTGGIAENVSAWQTIDPNSLDYQSAGDWTGVLFAVQAVGSILWAMALPRFKSVKMAYSLSLVIGAVGFISVYFFTNQYMLFVSFLLIGCAWAAMLALPFAILTSSLSGKSLGTYMGLFNCTICLPQIVAALVGMFIMKQVGEESYVNELEYPKSVKVENCAIVAENEKDADAPFEYMMSYDKENKRFVCENIDASIISGDFHIEANDGKVEYGTKAATATSRIAPNEAFGMTVKSDDVDIKDIRVEKQNENGDKVDMDEKVSVYFYPGCDRLFVMEQSDKNADDVMAIMPKATSGQIKMFIIAGVALLLGAAAVFGISTRRREE